MPRPRGRIQRCDQGGLNASFQALAEPSREQHTFPLSSSLAFLRSHSPFEKSDIGHVRSTALLVPVAPLCSPLPPAFCAAIPLWKKTIGERFSREWRREGKGFLLFSCLGKGAKESSRGGQDNGERGGGDSGLGSSLAWTTILSPREHWILVLCLVFCAQMADGW